MMEFIFGRLTWSSLPHEWFTIGGTIAMSGMMISAIALVTYLKRWKWLWREWLTTVDPKKIGIMYVIVASLMLFRGGLDAGMIWLQQAISVGSSHGYLNADHFQQIFTAHGVIMVFFVTMGFLFGLLNFIVPLQIGARDLASPFLNTLGFWLYVAGAILINLFFVFGGEFAATGWLAIAPLSELQYSPGVGVDFWIWSLQVSGLGTLLGGINFIMTIIKKRAPGMTMSRLPLFTWTSLFGMILVVSIFPILTATITLLSLDRLLGFHFFTTDMGGNAMMYTNLIWMWGHPEVYILILPSFGIYSEVITTFSQKKVAGYTSMVLAGALIAFIAMLVWLHHFFTMGSGADVNAFFGISTAFIAIPSGVQIFNWISSMYKGKIRYEVPMYWFLGFAILFMIGGTAGVLLSVPSADFQLHNSLFLVAHFHTMIIGGALFGIFAGITYWFPKVTGFKLHERLGQYAFWCWLVGFIVSFTPLYILGSMGAARRLDHYDVSTGWQPLFILAGFGFLIILTGAMLHVVQIAVSIMQREKLKDTTGDPWNGRTLEWSTASPPPFYNFALVPRVTSRDAFWEMKKNEKIIENPKYEDIEMPKNTALGIYVAAFVFLIGFGMVWHLFWLVAIGFIGGIVCVIIRTFDEDTEYVVTAEQVKKMEGGRKIYG
ncbi:MAG TPA: cbb3-type cytochrome c oxidase subunit I [Patescibacteria group bacterium]|nr:cbb3-type cytochrome c oxidase subunit I [Patescibacteria group bacterium]